MGLFSSKQIVSVSSTVYNLAGELNDRPNYLKNLVIKNTLSGSKEGLGTTLPRAYLTGPGIKLRSFYRWAQNNYTLVGMPQARITANASVPTDAVKKYIQPANAGAEIWVQDADLDNALFGYWVDQWMLANLPDKFDDREWTAAIDEASTLITITLTDGTVYQFYPANFDMNSRYIIAYYNEVSGGQTYPREVGEVVYIGSDPFPSTSGYTLADTDTETRPQILKTKTTTIKEYPNDSSKPSETSTVEDSSMVTITQTIREFTKSSYTGSGTNEDQTQTLKEWLYLGQDKAVYEGVSTSTTESGSGTSLVRTTKIVTQEKLKDARSTRRDRQVEVDKNWSTLKVFIYRIGSGISELDNYVNAGANYSQFFPVIPARLANHEVNEQNFSAMAEQAAKAYKKATRQRFDKLLDNIADNKDIKDIDHAYVVFGVSLNTFDQSSRYYLWEFFDLLRLNQQYGVDAYQEWAASQQDAKDAHARWLKWKQAQEMPDDPLFGTPQPRLPSSNAMPSNAFNLKNTGPVDIRYQVIIEWGYVRKGLGSGKGKPGAKKGEIWLEYALFEETGNPIYVGPLQLPGYDGKTTSTVRIVRQVTEDSYEFLIVNNLKYHNFVYENNFITVTAGEALADAEDSDLIIPIHYGTLRQMPIKHVTQVSTCVMSIVFQSYKITKQRWYQRGIFRILAVVVIAIVTAVFTGGAGLGILGTNAVVGGFFGLTGTVGAIVGSVVNALAAVAISTVIEKAATAIFGEVIGAVIASVLGIFIGGGGVNFSFSGGLSVNWSTILRVDNLLRLTDAIGKGVAAAINGDTMGIIEDMQDYKKSSENEARRIQSQYFQQFGYGAGAIDPFMFVDSSDIKTESRDTFLTRTLMTGSDIAQMSNELLNNYVELTNKLPDAFT